MEKPSKQVLSVLARREKLKEQPGLGEKQFLRSMKVELDKIQAEERKREKRRNQEILKTITPVHERKRPAKAPNPLSVKKKRRDFRYVNEE